MPVSSQCLSHHSACLITVPVSSQCLSHHSVCLITVSVFFILPSMRCKMSSSCSQLTRKKLLKLTGSSSWIFGISAWKAPDVSCLTIQFRTQQDLFLLLLFHLFSTLAKFPEQYRQQRSQLSDSWNILP